MTPEYYNKKSGGVKIDPYRILKLYDIKHPAIQHAIKKLLRFGRDHKNVEQDVNEVIEALQRFLEMEKEDNQKKEVDCG